MSDEPHRPNGLAHDILVMQCPECSELVMVPRGELETGYRVTCSHCFRRSTLALDSFALSGSNQWTLVPTTHADDHT